MRGRRYVLGVVMTLMLAAGCGSKTDVPERLRGVWKQADKEYVKMRFEPKREGEEGGVYLGMSPGPEVSWFGPLELRQYGENRWSFELATIERTEGNTTTRMQPPQVSESPDYVMDQRGRLLVRVSTHLTKPGEKVSLRLQGGQIVAEGLWVRVENNKWDEQGKPTEQKVTAMKTTFVRGSSEEEISNFRFEISERRPEEHGFGNIAEKPERRQGLG